MSRCLYCDKEKTDSEFSLEHIWPSALGGALLPPIFKTRSVCVKCNNSCGLFVDGGFVKSWFLQAEASINAHEFLDPGKPSPAPFVYFGEEPGMHISDDEVCDRWGGLAGDRVYHFHKRDDEKWFGIVGGDIIKRKKLDPGRAYIAFGSANEYWFTCAALSLRAQFEKAKRCVLNGKPASDIDARVASIFFPQRDPNDKQQLLDLKALDASLHGCSASTTVSIKLGFDTRFLCKIALGIGFNILGEPFKDRAYAGELRKGLWSKTPDERKGLRIQGSGFLGGGQMTIPDEVKQFMSIRGTWSLCIWRHDAKLAVHIHSPRRNHMSIVIEENCDGYDQSIINEYKDGVFYFVSPYRSMVVGPLCLAQILAHKLGEVEATELTKIEQPITKLEELPPKR